MRKKENTNIAIFFNVISGPIENMNSQLKHVKSS